MKKAITALLCTFLVGVSMTVASPDSFENDIGKQKNELFVEETSTVSFSNVVEISPLIDVQYVITKVEMDDILITIQEKNEKSYLKSENSITSEIVSVNKENIIPLTYWKNYNNFYHFTFSYKPTDFEYATSHYSCR